jgi:hypothetical protein
MFAMTLATDGLLMVALWLVRGSQVLVVDLAKGVPKALVMFVVLPFAS